MEVGNPAVAGPRTRRNKARCWSSPGARAAGPHPRRQARLPGMRASGPRFQGLASGFDHLNYVKSCSGTPFFSIAYNFSMQGDGLSRPEGAPRPVAKSLHNLDTGDDKRRPYNATSTAGPGDHGAD